MVQGYPLPPVPEKLREMLVGYPELISRLQETLSRSAERSRRVPVDPFEDAISALEGRLEKFASEARRELKEAEEAGDSLLIRAAFAKESLIDDARYKRHWIGDADLYAYFVTGFN